MYNQNIRRISLFSLKDIAMVDKNNVLDFLHTVCGDDEPVCTHCNDEGCDECIHNEPPIKYAPDWNQFYIGDKRD